MGIDDWPVIAMTMIWCSALDDDEYTNADFDTEKWFASGISWVDCQPVQGTFPDITLEISVPHPPRDYFHAGSMFIVSNRLKSVLEEFEVRAEFFPVRILYEEQEYQKQAYYYCNILDCVDCFDRTRGEYTFWPSGHVKGINKLAIDEDTAAGHDLFRIANGGEYIVCTSDRVAAAIIEQKCRGVVLKKPEDWNGM